uniref:Uncharacterized protein n=1 Tax=Kalanchoe fedtschenkoi TaxID=63787 RepID=A0A7N0R995_KALFE
MPSSTSADSCPDHLHRATRSTDTNSTINNQIGALPSTHESNDDRHQSAEADCEILFKPSHPTKPDNPSAQIHPPQQLHHPGFLTSATASATTASSHHRGLLGEGAEESDDGFRTPTNTIPSTAECPPAPKKAKSQKRSMSWLLQEESSQLYCGNDLVTEVEMWLEFLEEEEDRKKRLTKKLARRQASKLADATSTSHQLD